MAFLMAYGLFLAKLISIALVIFILILSIFGLAASAKSKMKGRLEIKKINQKFEAYKDTLTQAIAPKKDWKQYLKSKKKVKKTQANASHTPARLFVLDFRGDIRASAVSNLREEITALLTYATPDDEILLRLESSGGLVNAYGLASSQLERITAAGIHLTVSIDNMAASGGYMMACVAPQIIASPFAIVGSIGVIAQLPNFHRYLQKKCIDFEQITAGQFKRTLTVFGENTEKDREKMQQDIHATHQAFKAFIRKNRPDLDVESVATGEHWFAVQALDLKLIDALQTSDDYIMTAIESGRQSYEVQFKTKPTFSKRLSQQVRHLFQALVHQRSVSGGTDYI